MNNSYVRIGLAALLGGISAYLGIVAIPLVLLLILMLIDYGTGIAAAWMTGTLSSRESIFGILKKVGYLAVIAVGMTCDFLIEYALSTIGQEITVSYVVGLVIIIWLILNECISILENLSEMGVPFPRFLDGVVDRLKIVTEKQMEGIEKSSNNANESEGEKKE